MREIVELQRSSGAPITRLGTSYAALSKGESPSPHVVVCAGLNETSVFVISSDRAVITFGFSIHI